MEIEGDKLIFETGKEIYCCLGVIGLFPNKDTFEGRVKHGFDGTIDTVFDIGYDHEFNENALTKEECFELSEYMIKAWKDFQKSLKLLKR
jgi:hypothetical protein